MSDLSTWTALRTARRQRWAPPHGARPTHVRAEFDAPRTSAPRRNHRALTPAQIKVAERLYYRGSKVRYRCELDHTQTCADRNTLVHIGTSNADGYVQDLYKCPSCHAIWTTHEAFR